MPEIVSRIVIQIEIDILAWQSQHDCVPDPVLACQEVHLTKLGQHSPSNILVCRSVLWKKAG